VFQVILIHFLLTSTKFETFQQTGQTISQSDSDSTENHFPREAKTFLFLSEFRTVPNGAPFDKEKRLGAVSNGEKLKYFRGELD
jgi:hypothetical protein